MVDAVLCWLGSDLSAARLRMARFNLGEDAWLARADARRAEAAIRARGRSWITVPAWYG